MTANSLRDAGPLLPPNAPGMARGLLFAIAAHGLLLAALSAGVSWRTDPLPAFEAELWSAVPQAAAPREELPPPAPPEAEPSPLPKPVPVEDLQALRDADIAIAKARDEKKRDALRLAELEAARKKAALKEQAAEREKQAKIKQDKLDAKLKQEKQDKLAKEAEAKLQAKADAKIAAQRQDNLRRIQGMAGASGGANATGNALQSAGPSASYGGRIKARIRPNIIYTESGSGNPVAEVEVRTAPDGTIISRKLLKPSGDAEWDKAVLRAIDKTELLPRDVDGRVPALLVISFKPQE
jgi:colicin import membrane protein